MDYSRRFKKECLLFKVDFAKGYDCVSLEYQLYFGSNGIWLQAVE